MSEFFEGYCDGLAGAGMQDRLSPLYEDWRGGQVRPHPDEADSVDYYEDGFCAGSLDRKTMLTRNTPDAFALWAEGMGDGDA